MNIVQVRQFLELEERLLYTVDALEEPNIAVRALYDIYLIHFKAIYALCRVFILCPQF